MQTLPTQRARRVLLVVNPGSRRGARYAGAAESALRASGADVDVFVSDRPGAAAARVGASATAYDAVFALGGDGTVMEVIGAVGADGPPVGVLPGGTGNLLAQALRVPLDVARAATALVNGGQARIDTARLDPGGRFVLIAGVGIDSTMIAETPARLKQSLGVLSYMLTATRAMFRMRHFAARIDVDGVVHERRAASVLVANFGTIFGDLVTLGDGIRYDDGLLNVCAFSPTTAADAARVTWKAFRRDFSPDDALWYAAGRRIRVETDPPLAVQADGELVGTTPFTAQVEPLRVRLLVPRRA